MTFLPNPENKTNVGHANGIKHDNRLSNLSWETQKQNIDHAVKTGLFTTVPVNQFSMEGELIATYSSISEAAKDNEANPGGIHLCCQNKRKQHAGYKWELAEPHVPINTKKKRGVIQYTMEGQFLRIWSTMKEASQTLGVSSCSICMCAQGKLRSAGGYCWEYKTPQ